MSLSFDETHVVERHECRDCGRHYRLVKAFVARGDEAVAVVMTALHVHDGLHEAWIDAILGTFGDDDVHDHVTFGCRVGAVQSQPDPGATLVDAAQPYADDGIWGRRLTRSEALAHPWLPQYWEVVDFVLVEDPVIEHHVYGHGPAGR